MKPKIDSLWQHKNGNLYQVLLFANVYSDREDYPETIIYKNINNGKVYCRKLSDWHRSMTFITA